MFIFVLCGALLVKTGCYNKKSPIQNSKKLIYMSQLVCIRKSYD